MRTSTLFSMNRSAVLFIALFLVVGAFGASVTYYTDNNCGTKATSPFMGAPNPLVAPLNACVKAMEVSQGGQTAIVYVKFSVCSNSSYAIFAYSNSGCNPPADDTIGGRPGDCIRTDPPPGSQSYKIDCSNATSPPITPPSTTVVKSAAPNPASLMALILAFAFAAICTQV
jgi:hypothetical protein